MNIAIVPTSEHLANGIWACLDAVARERTFLARLEAPPPERIKAALRESIATQHCGTLGIGLLASHRGRGIGHQLMSACLLKAKATGLTRIELEVRGDNAQTIQLYQRMGFVQEAVKRRGMRLDGVYHDTWLMSLLVD